jgi:hypothetical protein
VRLFFEQILCAFAPLRDVFFTNNNYSRFCAISQWRNYLNKKRSGDNTAHGLQVAGRAFFLKGDEGSSGEVKVEKGI